MVFEEKREKRGIVLLFSAGRMPPGFELLMLAMLRDPYV